MSLGRHDLLPCLLLAALPALAYAPALTQDILLGPGDGAALHFPMKAAVWANYRRGELPAWNPAIFLGAPLFAAYRPGALFPPVALLTPLSSFAAFQLLVLGSLAAAGIAVYGYLRLLGAERVGAYVGGLCFSLGPYLVGHLGDTATLSAAALLPLALLVVEAMLGRATAGRAAILAVVVSLLLLAGSPEAARAGAVLLGARLLVAFLGGARQAVFWTAAALFAGIFLAAPQLLPSFFAAREAGRAVTGLAGRPDALPAGFTGLVLRYASHTPAGALALAAVPLLVAPGPARVLAAVLCIALALQWGQGPLGAPGALPLVFDLALCLLAGLSLSAQWRARREPLGRRLRAWLLVSCLGSAAALSVAAAALGPLPQMLAGAVGVLALALILYFPQSSSASTVNAGIWLLPLTISFLLQPHGRQVWAGAPTRRQLEEGTSTSAAITSAMGQRRAERTLTLVFDWPYERQHDLAYGGLAALAGRRSANGYDPLVPLRTRVALGGMSVGGVLPESFVRRSPRRLEVLGLRWLQVPTEVLYPGRRGGPLANLGLPLGAGQARFFPLPMALATTEVHLASCLQAGLRLAPGEEAAALDLRLASGRTVEVPLRAGAQLAAGGPEGDCRSVVVPLPARYRLDGLGLRLRAERGRLLVWRLGVRDAPSGRFLPVTPAAAYVSDGGLREAAVTPDVRLFELPNTLGPARVVTRLRALPHEQPILEALDLPPELGLDPREEALALARDVEGLALPAQGRPGRAEVVRAVGSRLEVRAQGPGVLVVSTAWDPGWRARVDGVDTPVVRVNHAQMAVPLGEGTHRVLFRHRPRGFAAGLVLSAMAAAALAGLTLWRGDASVPLLRT